MDVASLVTGLWNWLSLAYCFFTCWYKFRKAKSWFTDFWVDLVKDHSGLLVHSATSRYVLVPFERYGHQKKKKMPKKFLLILFLYIFHVKTKWNIYSLRILKSKNLFKRHEYPSPNALNIKYFWTFNYNHWGFFGITILTNP